MALKHTLGPLKAFKCVENNAPDYWAITDGKWGSRTIAKLYNESDAKLFASAPEMLEALVKAIDIMETEPGCAFYSAHIAKFKAIIAKAEGK